MRSHFAQVVGLSVFLFITQACAAQQSKVDNGPAPDKNNLSLDGHASQCRQSAVQTTPLANTASLNTIFDAWDPSQPIVMTPGETKFFKSESAYYTALFGPEGCTRYKMAEDLFDKKDPVLYQTFIELYKNHPVVVQRFSEGVILDEVRNIIEEAKIKFDSDELPAFYKEILKNTEAVRQEFFETYLYTAMGRPVPKDALNFFQQVIIDAVNKIKPGTLSSQTLVLSAEGEKIFKALQKFMNFYDKQGPESQRAVPQRVPDDLYTLG